jgi:hypothetical protein
MAVMSRLTTVDDDKEQSMDISSDVDSLGGLVAAALVKSMVSEGWSAARTWFSDFVQRHRGNAADRDTARLDTAQKALAASSEKDRVALAEKLETEWSVRLSDVLADHPDAIPDAQEFLTDHSGTTQKSTIGHNININAKAGRKATQNITGIGNIGTEPRK